ncbi:MAG: DUF4982 domain-containing protein [Bacteroidaceae bacterium]|nr:DUF4982 domain-containing protein [Bacteroidaceae bacterium]
MLFLLLNRFYGLSFFHLGQFRIKLLLIVLAALVSANAASQNIGRRLFSDNWTFNLEGQEPERVNLPHDWAVKGDFSQNNPSGTGGGALPGGTGWYRKVFTVDKKDKGQSFRIDFDGVYMNATVWINGKELGTRPYGYISFGYDITPYLKFGKENEILVKVDNKEQPNSRWYSGCGIYRNVWLTKTNKTHIAKDGVYVKYYSVSSDKLITNIETKVENGRNCVVENVLVDASGKEVATGYGRLEVNYPKLWSTDNPYLYTLVTKLKDKTGKVLDEYYTRIGFRNFAFTDKGFTLNGKPMQIQGACLHHDLGCLGAAVNKRALQRQLQIMKDMGLNGIRCSHNPPSPELLDLCDEMGLLVMDEAFDMWRKKKTAHDYARYFNDWHEQDLHDFVVRDRNHPCIVMWSIGNEVLEQWTQADADTLSLEEANLILNFGHSSDMLAKDGEEMSVNSLLTKKLADVVRDLDPTRPITAGCNEPDKNNHLFKSGALDIIGYNYHNVNIPDVPKNFPGKPFIITESNSALMTRGYYRMPSDSMYIWPERWDKPFFEESYSCSSYDNCHVPWGNTNEENLLLLKRNPWICGQFIWTGFDYIGEPTPYGWPARSSYFGVVDLAGFPKDVYYLYQAELTDKDVLHLFPHWTWNTPQGRSALMNGKIDMWAYYNNADELELFVNGKSQGISRKTEDRLHAMWRVDYEDGEVEVVARKDGQVVRSKKIRTAGAPAKIRLTPDRTIISADGRDISFVTVEIVDKDGNLCPWAENLVNFSVEGKAFIAGVDNGSPTSLERFSDNKRKAFYGKCLVVLQNDGKAGNIILKATSEQLRDESVIIFAQ